MTLTKHSKHRPTRHTNQFSAILIWFMLAPCLAFAQTIGEIPPEVRVVTNGHNFPADAYTLLVQEVGNPTPLLAVNTGLPMNPASTIKTLTTLAGLEVLGPDYRWQTEIYALGPVVSGTLQGDLLIRGGADPFLVEEHVRSMLKILQRRGVQRITGDLILDNSLFDASVRAGRPVDNQSGRAYNVLPEALLFNFQVVNFHFYPHTNGRDVIIHSDPALPNLTINNRLQLSDTACTGFQRGISFSEDKTTNTVTFSGQHPASCGEYSMTRAVLDAAQYNYGLFQSLWQELGGEFEGQLREQSLSAITNSTMINTETTSPLVTWQSPPLADIIKSINKYSNNMMTRQLLLTLGMQNSNEPASIDSGIAAVRAYLTRVGIDDGELEMANGSGLSRDTRLTADLLGNVLQRGFQIPTMPEFVASLPLAGLDGTMQDRLTTGDGAGSSHIKTGSLNGVAGIAGYVHARSGRHYIVVALVNHAQAHTGPGQELGDALLRWVWRQ
ncbi:D-alanyl-D-alanine carboxypeptidase/D-alanyl-D-alanine endopeptidase [Pseudohongiella sp.]|uniref:D-alanyl-D-alanine carboxypeptidase/D-alanyl-D-alanine-endopeptidase n=1 Tax=marine sediment metagenome TaxID=412755 RepID=A0A0F9W2K9_9ZZZZ|nr:D-alanyl-D-alanine carboxypeptidase/D-alanyl-D-alanine-endopeptidase [Pseudohongiella sp.]HDZ09253.1 D-alanyl-D-alanine carboxypeptidase/D-alanyl-D-alanine-endopeptidase [Pseudohongiella sp.]HEA62117.1 D-alanyl-D-alanine carboxypeptidase/D-alanyl-D-alanine-endopeptidase [Pseudohongiella sp.]